MFRIGILVLISTLYLFSSDLNTTEENFIDVSHEYITKKFNDIANTADDVADKTITYTKNIGSDDNKTETQTQTKKDSTKELNPESVDALFQNEKYIGETKRSYLRLSSDYVYNSLEKSDFNVRLNASLALNKSQKNLKLYLSGFNQDNVDDVMKREGYDDGKPEIGVSYVALLKNSIETKYSLGIRSLYPYVRGRFSYRKETSSWVIEPIQTVEYSLKDEFREKTDLYLDTQIIDKVKFRLEFSRGTESQRSGMEYNSVASIFWVPQSTTGIQLSQGFFGHTKYEYTDEEDAQNNETYSGINNYVTTLTFRQNIYRKWLFYEISPGVDFKKIHDFDPNYSLYLRLDAFFGKM